MLVSGRLHTWVCVEIIADELAQDACSGAVQDAHSASSHQYGIVDEVGDSLQCFLAAHASYVNVLLEVQVFVAYLVLCIAAYKGDDSLPLVLFGLLGTYQPLDIHGGLHHAEGHRSLLAVYLVDDTHGGLSLQFYCIAGLQRLFCLGGDGGSLLCGSGFLLGTLAFVLLLALLPFLYLTHLALDELIVGRLALVQQFLGGRRHLLSCQSGALLLGLCLAYFPDSVLDGGICLLQDFLRLLLGLLDNLHALLLQFGHLLLIACDGLLHLFLA